MAIPRSDIARGQVPSSTGQQALNPDAFNAPAKAMQGLGHEAMQFSQKMQLEEGKLYFAEARAKELELKTEAENRLSKDIDVNSPKYREKLKEVLDAVHETYINNAPNKITRDHLKVEFAKSRGQAMASGVLVEQQAQLAHAANMVPKTLTTLNNIMSLDPGLYEQTKAQGLATIYGNEVLTRQQKDQAAIDFISKQRYAQLKKRIETEPVEVYKELAQGLYVKELDGASHEKILKEAHEWSRLTLAKDAGQNLLTVAPQERVDRFLNFQALKKVQEQGGKPLSLQQMAQIAAENHSPWSQLAYGINQAVNYGSAEDKGDALLAYRGLKAANSPALANIPDTAKTKLDVGNDYLSNMPAYGSQDPAVPAPVAAMKEADRATNPEFKAEADAREHDAKTDKAYLPDVFETQLLNAMGLRYWWNPIGAFDNNLPIGVAERARADWIKLFKSNKIDKQAALRMVADNMKASFGPNPLRSKGSSSSEYMELPPDRQLNMTDKRGQEELRQQFNYFLLDMQKASLAPDAYVNYKLGKIDLSESSVLDALNPFASFGKENDRVLKEADGLRASPERLERKLFEGQIVRYYIDGKHTNMEIFTDQITRQSPPGQPSYAVGYRDKYGNIQLAPDPRTGLPARFTPRYYGPHARGTKDFLTAEEAAGRIEEQRAKAQAIRDKYATKGPKGAGND